MLGLGHGLKAKIFGFSLGLEIHGLDILGLGLCLKLETQALLHDMTFLQWILTNFV